MLSQLISEIFFSAVRTVSFLPVIGSHYFSERLELLHSGIQKGLQPGRERESGRANVEHFNLESQR